MTDDVDFYCAFCSTLIVMKTCDKCGAGMLRCISEIIGKPYNEGVVAAPSFTDFLTMLSEKTDIPRKVLLTFNNVGGRFDNLIDGIKFIEKEYESVYFYKDKLNVRNSNDLSRNDQFKLLMAKLSNIEGFKTGLTDDYSNRYSLFGNENSILYLENGNIASVPFYLKIEQRQESAMVLYLKNYPHCLMNEMILDKMGTFDYLDIYDILMETLICTDFLERTGIYYDQLDDLDDGMSLKLDDLDFSKGYDKIIIDLINIIPEKIQYMIEQSREVCKLALKTFQENK